MKKEFFFVIVLILLCLTLFFLGLGNRPLWDRDEGEHASTSKDMVLSGDWITPKLNGENFYDKPVLHYWFVAISFLAFGFTEFAARLPAAVLGLGGVLVTYLLGRRMFGVIGGFFGGVILATNPEYTVLSRHVLHDISLTFFMTLALLFFYLGFKSDRHRRVYFLLFYASLGFSVLAKGPLGVLLPALIIGLFLVLTNRLRFLKDMGMGWGFLIFLAVAAPWYILISLRNSDYLFDFFFHNNVMRFLSSKAQHRGPLYYYFPALLGGFFPWSCFLPLAILRAFSWQVRKIKEDHLFLLLWFFTIFLFFSAARSKLATYILPLFPALSLLVGSLWTDFMEAPTLDLRKGLAYSLIPLLVILPLGLVYLWISPPLRIQTKFGVDLIGYGYLFVWMMAGAGIALGLLLNKRVVASLMTLAGAIVSLMIFVEFVILPSIDPFMSTKDLAQKMDQMVPPGEKFVYYGSLEGGALFYTDRRALLLRTPGELRNFLDTDKRVFCMISRNLYDKLDNQGRMSYIIDKQGYKLIISNRN